MDEHSTCNLWKHNLKYMFHEFVVVSNKFRILVVDSEYPGVVVEAIGPFTNFLEETYANIRLNVGSLKPIQIGITVFDEFGETPVDSFRTWEFNFKFDLNKDKYSPTSIELLKKAGIDFKRHASEGIDPAEFAELMLSSGLLQRQDIAFVTFHGTYDFAYLVKILTKEHLPVDRSDFFRRLRYFFRNVYDTKCIMGFVNIFGGLEKLAEYVEVQRQGEAHHAGSDSHLTGKAFFRLVELYFLNGLDRHLFNGLLWLLGGPFDLLLSGFLTNDPGYNQYNGVQNIASDPALKQYRAASVQNEILQFAECYKSLPKPYIPRFPPSFNNTLHRNLQAPFDFYFNTEFVLPGLNPRAQNFGVSRQSYREFYYVPVVPVLPPLVSNLNPPVAPSSQHLPGPSGITQQVNTTECQKSRNETITNRPNQNIGDSINVFAGPNPENLHFKHM